MPGHLSNHRRKGQRNHSNSRHHFYYGRLLLWFVTGMCMCMFIVSVVQQYMPQSNHVFKRWTNEQPAELFVTAIGMEIPLLQTYQRDADGQSAAFPVFTKQSLSTSLIDPQLFFRQELPGFTLYEGQVVIPGQDGNYADIPIESSPPMDILTAEREAMTEGPDGHEGEQGENGSGGQTKQGDQQDQNEQQDGEQQEQAEPREDDQNEGQNDGQNAEETPDVAPDPDSEHTTEGREVVYIYHAHSRESWLPHMPDTDVKEEAFHPEVNVTLLGERLAEELERKGIGTYHENADVTQMLEDTGLPYTESYAQAREVVEPALAEKKDVTFIFDIHRDSLPRERTTAEINGQDYARTYFIIGGQNEQYERNLAFAERFHNALEAAYPGLSRGVYLKHEGDGEYNQSLSENNLLIEIGGVENTLEESYRTVEVLADVIVDLYWDAEKVDARLPLLILSMD